MKKPEQEPDLHDIFEETKNIEPDSLGSGCRASIPSEQFDSLSSADSLPQSSSSSMTSHLNQEEQNFTTPSNFKTHAMFYGENDPVPNLEQDVADLINSLFWVVESKRLERSREKLEKVSLILAPFEKKDFVGLDMESRNNKKRCMGRVTKNLADLTLQAGMIDESLNLYHSAAEILKSVNDWLWLGAAYEGLCAASAILQYPNLRNSTPLQRNASLQESSPNKTKPLSLYQPNQELFKRYRINSSPLKSSKTSSPINPPSELTPSSSESVDTSSRQSETDNADTESLASSSDIEYQSQRPYIASELPSIPRQTSSQTNISNQFILKGEDIAEKYRKAIIHYSKYQNAGIIETEACFKGARIAVEQNNSLNAAGFLQNVVFINLTLSEQEKIQRFDTIAELYKEIGFLRKAAFCQRLAATRQVCPSNPNPDWQRCYYSMLHSFPGHKLSLDPSYVVQHQVGWPALQIQLLQELVVAARRMGHPALATRHMTFLLQTMWPHLSKHEQRDLAIQLQALSAQCEGGPVPLVLETGEVIPPANLTHVPQCSAFLPKPLPPARNPHLIKSKTPQGPFIFTPIHFGSLERKTKRNDGKLEYIWVEDDICEVQMKLTNPLPFELKVSNMRLLTSGVVFESIPETIILPPASPTTVNLHGTPKEVGELQILGYSTHTLGVKSNCRLKNMPMPNKFPSSFTVEVIPSLPTITIETSVLPSGLQSGQTVENIGSTTNISLYNGESTECTMNITNTSNVSIEYLDISVQLPIAPNEVAKIIIKLYGEADFLDLGGVGCENLFPNSLTSNYPSRVGSPVPNAQNSLQNTQSSNPHTSLSSGLIPNRQFSGSFRSTNSHATSWSAPISVMPPSRGRQIETQVIIRYSGGSGKEIHCRQSNLQINLELLPSVSITHWDVLPAEVPTQLYLVLDVTNLTSQEMDLNYAPGKQISIESNESCRIPVPLDRCPFNTNLPAKEIDDDTVESKSTITGSSTNSLELMCSEHITNNVSLQWHLQHSDAHGRASVRGITLSQAMMDIVRMSPLNWEVSLNSQSIKPQEEYTCTAGECLSLANINKLHMQHVDSSFKSILRFPHLNRMAAYPNSSSGRSTPPAPRVPTLAPPALHFSRTCRNSFACYCTHSIETQCSHASPPHDIAHISRIEEEVLQKTSLEPKDDLAPVSLSEVQTLVKSLKTRKAPGLDAHSCPQQVLRLVEYVSEGFETERSTVAVFDVAKAFDRVWHAGMSALTRQDVLSEQEFLKAPPSPLLYSAYTNDVPRPSSSGVQLALFADDTALFTEIGIEHRFTLLPPEGH
ncbi:Protein brunelleschi [Eumeta japonica]|uniref:Protein brunelleschi n=1 Tax=Eumeta variegata TaxID=151549 RepID=A0A4C1VMT7_EUMVA|nr:Protein brunelleschi [Eumeta japonica]